MNNIINTFLEIMLLCFMVLSYLNFRLARNAIKNTTKAINAAKDAMAVCNKWEDICKRQNKVIEGQFALLKSERSLR